MNKNICYISYNSIKSPLLESQGLGYLEELSKKMNYIFTIITFEEDIKSNESNFISTRLKSNNIRWFYFHYRTSRWIILKPILYIFNMYRIKKIIKREKFSVIHLRGYSSILTYILYRKRFKSDAKLLFDLRNPTIDEFIWQHNYNYFLKIIFFKIEYIMFRNASAIIVVSDYFKNFVKKKLNKYSLNIPIFVVKNGVDTIKFNFQNYQEINSYNSNILKLVYIGSLDKFHSIEKMIDFYKELYHTEPKSKFLIATNSLEISNIKYLINKNYSELESNISIFHLPHSDIPRFLSSCSAGICFFSGEKERMKMLYPIKIGEYLASGLPVIMNELPKDISEILKKTSTGVIVEEMGKENFKKAIIELKKLLNEKDLRLRCLKTAEKFFSFKQSLKELEQCYRYLTEK